MYPFLLKSRRLYFACLFVPLLLYACVAYSGMAHEDVVLERVCESVVME